MRITKLFEFFLQVNILACKGWCFNGMGNLFPLFGIKPGNEVFQPGKPVIIYCLPQANGGIQSKWPK